MSLRDSFTIAFSPRLHDAPVSEKQNALSGLLESIEENPHIEDTSVEGVHILETIYSLFVSFVEERDVLKKYRLTIAVHELDFDDVPSIEKLGFDVYQKEGAQFLRMA